MPTSKAPSAPAVPAAFVNLKPRQSAYRVAVDAASAEVPGMPRAVVTRGFRVNGGAESPECLVLVDGSRQTGLALPVLAAAIVGKVITRAEIESLLALSE